MRELEQIDKLASFIIENIPGEPSQSEGAVDTAIRLLKNEQQLIAAERAAAKREFAEQVKQLMANDFTKDTTHFLPKDGFVTAFNEKIDELLQSEEI